MCNLSDEVERRGEATGIVKLLRSMIASTEEILKKVMEQVGLSEEEAKKFL